jgi:hypothetical protein
MQLANKEFLFDDAATARSAYLGLVDILFGYAYNYRATGGENDVESPWNIARISSSLSWFDVSGEKKNLAWERSKNEDSDITKTFFFISPF